MWKNPVLADTELWAFSYLIHLQSWRVLLGNRNRRSAVAIQWRNGINMERFCRALPNSKGRTFMKFECKVHGESIYYFRNCSQNSVFWIEDRTDPCVFSCLKLIIVTSQIWVKPDDFMHWPAVFSSLALAEIAPFSLIINCSVYWSKTWLAAANVITSLYKSAKEAWKLLGALLM